MQSLLKKEFIRESTREDKWTRKLINVNELTQEFDNHHNITYRRFIWSCELLEFDPTLGVILFSFELYIHFHKWIDQDSLLFSNTIQN